MANTSSLPVKLAVIAAASVLVAGCNTAMGVTNFGGDKTAQSRTAFTLGIDESDVTVLNGRKSGVRYEYRAVTPQGEYNCYYTNQIGVSSDAMCTTLGSAPAPQQCNDLLKAAGKC